jgi:hypothetical protein
MAIGLATLNEPDANSVWNRLGADDAKRQAAANAETDAMAALVNSDEIDYSILNDRSHPLHELMVKRWNDRADDDGDDD